MYPCPCAYICVFASVSVSVAAPEYVIMIGVLECLGEFELGERLRALFVLCVNVKSLEFCVVLSRVRVTDEWKRGRRTKKTLVE